MAFECSKCKGKSSIQRVEVRLCTNCGHIEGSDKLYNLLRKLGVQEETIDKVRNDLVSDAI